MERKIYDDEFKKEIVELVTSKTKTTAEIAREYGMTAQTIRAWSKQYKKSKTFGVRAGLSPIERENIELKKKIKEVEEENEILKKATAIFSKLTQS